MSFNQLIERAQEYLPLEKIAIVKDAYEYAEDMRSSVQAIEVEAEKLLKEARSKANEILAKANEETNRILSSELPMDDVKAECDRIISKAREEADKKIEESRGKASEIQTEISKRMDKITRQIVSIISGVEVG